jgi:hypothetical protein
MFRFDIEMNGKLGLKNELVSCTLTSLLASHYTPTPTPQRPVQTIVLTNAFCRCVMTLGPQWITASDSLKFWLADHGDTKAEKLALVERLSRWCFDCQPPKARLVSVGCQIVDEIVWLSSY